jgi:hypothetical protein
MREYRTAVVPALMALVLAAAPTRSPGQVLVPGDPPLTREVVNLYQQMWEWYCDVRLAPGQRRQHLEAFANFWRKRSAISNRQSLAVYSAMEKNWRGILELKGAEQDRERAKVRERWLTALRKSNEDVDRLLVSVYDAAYRPGGPKNPILVKDDPPLAQRTVDEYVLFMEWLLGCPLTDQQRRAYQERSITEWKSCNRSAKEARVRNAAELAKVIPTLKPFDGNFQRTRLRDGQLAAWKENKNPGDGWAFELYQALYRPGGPNNALLVEGEPLLTEEVARRYGDYLEFVLDFSVSGELTAAQRRTLQGYLVRDWKRWDGQACKALLAALEDYQQKATRPMKEVSDWRLTERARVLARLRTARDDECSQWLLEIVNQERQKYKLASEQERRRHEMAMNLLRWQHEMTLITTRAIPTDLPRGHWEYNGATGSYDRWVPDR